MEKTAHSDFSPDFASPSQWVAMYRFYGLQIVPGKMPVNGGEWKMPALASWTEFQENLVPQATIDRWYGPDGEHADRQNMGIITGRCSGNVFVTDLDDQKGPEAQAWWHGLLELHNSGMELETVEQRTGGGGRQKLFRAPMDWVAPTNKTAIHIDIRGQGGFAMMPGSMHESGLCYEWLTGCAPWEMPIAAAPEWLLEEIEKLVERHGGQSSGKHTHTASGAKFDAFGNITDDRETYMRDLIWATVVDLRRNCPIPPGDSERDAAWIVYERNTRSRLPDDGRNNTERLEEEGRGPNLFANKWRRAIRKWGDKVHDEAAKPKPAADNRARERDYTGEFEKAKINPGLAYPYLDIGQIMDKPDPVWAVESLINEKSLALIFGPPSSLKTFIALDYGLSTATRLPTWWGHKINRHGAVIYLCREGTVSFKFRIKAWELHRKTSARDAPFYLVEHPTNFMNKDDRIRVIATIEAVLVKAAVPVAAIIVDTVSRVLPGAKENLQEDMSLFVEACEAIQHRFECIVLGIHHTNKNGGIRGSTVIPGAGDTLIETRREPGIMAGSIFVQKVKDGDDGYEVSFNVTKIDLTGGIVPRASLVVDPCKAGEIAGSSTASGPKDGLPDMMICREILAAIAQAWFNGAPMSVDNSARPAVRMIMARWFLKRDAVKRLLAGWMANSIIEHTELPGKKNVKGYRKLTDL